MMYEPYLNREKQYLKMNAELDNRFREIDPITKGDTGDLAKPRLNVFGNGSKVTNPKSVVHGPKQKRNERNCGTTPKTSVEVLALNQNNLGESASILMKKGMDTNSDRTQKLRVCVANNLLSQGNLTERKSSHNVDDKSSFVQVDQSQIQNTIVNGALSPKTNDTDRVKKNISSEGLIKFLKSKVAILKQELEQCQQENVKNLRAYEGVVESNKKTVAQMDHLANENAGLKDQIEKLLKTNTIHESVIKEKDADLVTVNKEMAVVKKQLKEVNRLHNVLEKRFLKCQDDLEHLKKNLNTSQDCERQQRAVNQQQKFFFEDQIKILSKQRTGLISAYKKQLLLLDNLKRQNLCLEQSKLLQLAEKDFMKILDWNN